MLHEEPGRGFEGVLLLVSEVSRVTLTLETIVL
jgi:hypothetical protein